MIINAFSKTYGERCVLDFPGMIAEAGKIYAVIGANGSGKSTFAKVLAEIEKADNGAKATEGLSIGYMPQKSFAFRMSTRKNVLMNGENQEKADSLIESFKLTGLSAQKAGGLSGGETARMAMARLMMKNYDIAIFDEPTASMDMESTFVAEKQLVEYSKSSGGAVFLITHSVSQAERVADEILYFENGKLIEKNSAYELVHLPKEKETAGFLQFYGI